MEFSNKTSAEANNNKLSTLSTSQQVALTRTGGLPIDFRQGTFRSPHASPGGKMQQMHHSTSASQSNSNKGGTSSTTAKAAALTANESSSMKNTLIANQHFY